MSRPQQPTVKHAMVLNVIERPGNNAFQADEGT